MPTTQMPPRRSASTTPIACLALAVSLALAGEGLAAPQTPRVSEACLSCHAGQDSTLAGTPHQLPHGAPDAPGARVACTDCHPGDSRHWEEDPAQYRLADPSKLRPAAAALACLPCHQGSHQQDMVEKNVHATQGVNCSGCHSVHRSKHAAQLRKPEAGLCLDCHADVSGQLARSSHHPVREGVVKCSDCHGSLDLTRRALATQGSSEVCQKCHAEFQGPFPHEHPAALGFSTDEGGCMTCHEPHGSNLPRLLKQPYEPPRFQLCTQCHSVPRHASNSMHGTRWAGMACNDCHVDIHGSFTSRLFLSESLRGCFNAGCHQRF